MTHEFNIDLNSAKGLAAIKILREAAKKLYIDPPYKGGEMISGIGEKTIATIKQQLCDLVDSHKRNLQKAFSGSEDGEIKVSFGVDIRQAADNLSIETKISYVVEKVTDKQAGFINENQPMLFPVTEERLSIIK